MNKREREVRNSNALYLRLWREGGGELNEYAEDPFYYGDFHDSDYEQLSDHDKKIVDCMTEHEIEDEVEWNENVDIDFESAMEKLIEIFDAYKGSNIDVRWCSVCGEPMVYGYMIDGGEGYACSDKCRNEYYKKHRGAKDDADAECIYLLECNNLYDLDEEYMEDYDIDKLPENMTLSELKDFIEENDIEIGDETFYTEWV